MSIDFSAERWERIREVYSAWWAGELDRPLIHVSLYGRDPGREPPPFAYRHFTGCYDASITPEDAVDAWDHELSCRKYLGDAFPWCWPNFGPGVLAAMLGAELVPGDATIWFHAAEMREVKDLHFTYDPDNRWVLKIRAICRAAMERWQGLVQMSMTDLGGASDVLHTFRPGERLLYDLFDDPGNVRRTIGELHELWWEAFADINSALQPVNPGYTAWSPIFSCKPYYMLQSDVSYMLGPKQFGEFIAPELEMSCRKLGNAFYHLDGPGQLPHLDRLLSIPELKGIQWIPGAGQPDYDKWPQVYRQIREAGKLAQIYGNLDTLDSLAQQLGSARGIILFTEYPIGREAEVRERLARYGAQ